MRYTITVTKSDKTTGAFAHLSKGARSSYIGMFFPLTDGGAIPDRHAAKEALYNQYMELLNKIFGIFLWTNYAAYSTSKLFSDLWEALRAVCNGDEKEVSFRV